MDAHTFDIAVFGSTPAAGLIAGLLATKHGMTVCLVGAPFSPFRIRRGIDLSVLPITRPTSWALLGPLVAETIATIDGFGGKAALVRCDAALIGETAHSIEGLEHFRHMALGYDQPVSRLAEKAPSTSVSFRARGVATLVGDVLEPVMRTWLEKAGVRRFDAKDVGLTLARGGAGTLSVGNERIEVGRIVLADDDAIIERLDDDQRGDLLRVVPMIAMLTAPTRPLGVDFVRYVERGVSMWQQGHAGITIVARSGPDLEARVGASLAGRLPLKRVGPTHFHAIDTVDGAPVIGPLKGSKAFIVAGLGPQTAFFAPAIARLIAARPSESEQAWFAPRDPAKIVGRAKIADFRALPKLEEAS